jgi:hypothetical protein
LAPYSPIYGAALSAHLAGLLASSMKLNKFILEGVSNVIMSALKSPTLIRDAHIEHVIQETITSFPPPPYGRLKIFQEVKTSVPFMWHIGPRQGFSRVAFPP